MSICIFPGRFQPFHNGHLLVVKGMMQTCGRTAIVVCCNVDDKIGAEDIFTQDEVREMISAALSSEDIVDAEIHVVTDCPQDDEWLDRILEAVEDSEGATIWSGNPDVLAIAEKAGVAVKKISPVPGISGEEIRAWVKSGSREWMEKVPAGALDVVMDKVEKKD